MWFVGVCRPAAGGKPFQFGRLQREVGSADVRIDRVSRVSSIHRVFIEGEYVVTHERTAEHIGAEIERILTDADMRIVEEVIAAASGIAIK